MYNGKQKNWLNTADMHLHW